jgi:hypothetical protein
MSFPAEGKEVIGDEREKTCGLGVIKYFQEPGLIVFTTVFDFV